MASHPRGDGVAGRPTAGLGRRWPCTAGASICSSSISRVCCSNAAPTPTRAHRSARNWPSRATVPARSTPRRHANRLGVPVPRSRHDVARRAATDRRAGRPRVKFLKHAPEQLTPRRSTAASTAGCAPPQPYPSNASFLLRVARFNRGRQRTSRDHLYLDSRPHYVKEPFRILARPGVPFEPSS